MRLNLATPLRFLSLPIVSLPPLLLLLSFSSPAGAADAHTHADSGSTQVFFHPAPPQNGPAPTLSAAQAQVVMAHHLGMDLSAEETPDDPGIWGHLLHIFDKSDRPRVVVVSDLESAQVVIPPNLHPAFYLDAPASHDVLAPYITRAREAADRIKDLPVVKTLLDGLDLVVHSAQAQRLRDELMALISLADALWSSAEEGWDAVGIDLGLAEKGSELWEMAAKGVKAGLLSMTQPDSPPLIVVVTPNSGQEVYSRPLAVHYRRGGSARGVESRDEDRVEVDKGKHKDKGKGKDKNKHKDKDKHKDKNKNKNTLPTTYYVAPLATIAGVSLFMIAALMLAISMLYGVGNVALPSTLDSAGN